MIVRFLVLFLAALVTGYYAIDFPLHWEVAVAIGFLLTVRVIVGSDIHIPPAVGRRRW